MKIILLSTLSLLISFHISSQNSFYWDSLNGNPNLVDANSIIKFSTGGQLIYNIDKSLNIESEDFIRIVIKSQRVFLHKDNDSFNLNTTNYQFNLKFKNNLKLFKIYERSSNNNIENEDSIKKTKGVTLSSIYYNSCLLNDLFKDIKSNKETIFTILNELNVSTDNNFLKEYLPNKANTSASTTMTISKAKAFLTNIGGLDVTSYADGLAKFLVKRAKTELSVAYFEKFREELESLKVLQTLFPATHNSLSLIGQEIYDYNRYLNVLRENYQDDFKNLPESVTKLIKNDNNLNIRLKSMFLLSSDIILGIRDKEHPGIILASIDSLDIMGMNTDVKNAIILTKAFSEALKDTIADDKAPYWVDKSKIQKITKDSTFRKIFWGILINDLKTKGYGDLYNLLNDEKKFSKINAVISELSDLTHQITRVIKQNATENDVTKETIANYIDLCIGLFGCSNKVNEIFYQKDKRLDTLLNYINLGNTLFKNIYTNQYSSAIYNVMEIFTVIRPNSHENEKKWLMKYGGFMAAMIDTKNSDDVERIIETYALPSGSSRVKRSSHCNISLNGFIGVYGGYEKDKFVSGIAAPVGIAFSQGGKCGSLSLFISAIDIGAISAFRFNNDTSQIAKIYLKEIFSPGVFISYGIPRSPISINLGFQRTPFLTKVGNTQNEVAIQHNTRCSLSFLVDIPLLNLYNRTYKFTQKAKK